MHFFIISFLLFFSIVTKAQELYPYTEPASNMPANSVSAKLGAMFGKGTHSDRILQCYTPEIMFGFSKEWMIHASASFSDMHEPKFIFESVRAYAKYRFLSNDGLHRHFRMAAFATASYSRNHLDHNELSLSGDHSGVQVGIVATQLINKFAISGTVGLTELLDEVRWYKDYPKQYAFEALNYSLSGGLLLFPREYKDYNQTNLNLYAELLGGYNLDWPYERYYIDLAPSVQFIFNSTGKLNIGYRFELAGDTYRLMDNSFMISYEYLFLNAFRR